jgi:hypothetical protein
LYFFKINSRFERFQNSIFVTFFKINKIHKNSFSNTILFYRAMYDEAFCVIKCPFFVQNFMSRNPSSIMVIILQPPSNFIAVQPNFADERKLIFLPALSILPFYHLANCFQSWFVGRARSNREIHGWSYDLGDNQLDGTPRGPYLSL